MPDSRCCVWPWAAFSFDWTSPSAVAATAASAERHSMISSEALRIGGGQHARKRSASLQGWLHARGIAALASTADAVRDRDAAVGGGAPPPGDGAPGAAPAALPGDREGRPG